MDINFFQIKVEFLHLHYASKFWIILGNFNCYRFLIAFCDKIAQSRVHTLSYFSPKYCLDVFLVNWLVKPLEGYTQKPFLFLITP